jgi:hypothetical protein
MRIIDIIIIIIIIIIGKDTISFMQGIYTYIPETNHVLKQYNVTAILSLLFMVPISLAAALPLMYFYIRTFRSMCAVPNMAVFCSSLTSWFPGMVLTYFLNNFVCVHYVYVYFQANTSKYFWVHTFIISYTGYFCLTLLEKFRFQRYFVL